MKMLNALVLTVALALMATPSAYALPTNLIINGSFETPDVGPGITSAPVGGWEVFYVATAGWTPVNNHGFEIQDHVIGRTGVAWEAYDGNQLAEMDAYANGGMFQTVSTTIGQSYNFSFAYSPRPDLVEISSGIDVYFNDVLIDSIWTDGGLLTNTIWNTKRYTLTATGTSSTIKFLASPTGNSDGMSTLIDDIQLSAVPMPSTMLLLGSGLVGLVVYGRRRFKK